MTRLSSWSKRFIAEPIAQTMAEVSWFGFISSAVLIAAAVNLGTGAFTTVAGPWAAFGLLVVLSVVTLVCANLYARGLVRRITASSERVIAGLPNPQPRRGLIVTPTKAPTARAAVDYHSQDGSLAHLWIITTPEMQEAADHLKAYAESRCVSCHPVLLEDEYDANGCYHLVQDIALFQAPRLDLKPGELIADMTGGTKPMAAGMVLAAADSGSVALEHVPTRFVDGAATVPHRPIEVMLGRSERRR